MASNQYECVIKFDNGSGSSQFAGTDTSNGASSGAQAAGGGSAAQSGAMQKIKGFAKGAAALGITAAIGTGINYAISHVEMYTGNKAIQDQIDIAKTFVTDAASFGLAAATGGVVGMVAWGVGKLTSFAVSAAQYSYNKQQEEYARQLNYERQSEGRYFE